LSGLKRALMKAPSFYCENCGNPVSLKASSCPSCGREFESVKCPECGFTGRAALFSDGCPSCGYMSSFGSSGRGVMEVDLDRELTVEPPEEERHTSRRVLPAWAYTLITLGLIGALIALLVIYLNLD
jgi:predicted RNA-binding Zn-ribbon protein involved in translation (DUF1610 family)